jgi:hypothetical protein
MAQSEPIAFFLRFLEERFTIFRQKLDNLLQVVTNHDPKQKVEACRATLDALTDLKRSMSSGDHPDWIRAVGHRLNWYVSHYQQSDAGHKLLKTIIEQYPQILAQRWNFDGNTVIESVDFDAVYTRYYGASRVPELFEELLAKIEQIIDSGEIDSLRVIRSLEKLVATIRRNIRGSYFSTAGTLQFAVTLLRNYLWEALSEIPAIGSLVKAVKATIEELDVEMAQVHDDMRQEIAAQVQADLPMLEYSRGALPAPQPSEGMLQAPTAE